MVRWHLNRKGQFTVKTTGPNHCGTSDVLAVQYFLKVTCRDGSLDKRGFLFDQTKVDKFFQTLKETSLSCEQFCEDSARKLYKQIVQENKICLIDRMELTLSPEPFMAALTFEYEFEEKKAGKKAA